MEDAVRRRSRPADEQGDAGAVSAGIDGQADERARAARARASARTNASSVRARCASAPASSIATSAAATARSISRHAIMQSCDIYFYEMIRRLGYDRVAPVARAVGLGEKFDLPFAHASATAPSPTARGSSASTSTGWTVADSLNASIGQGYVLANPLQLAVMAARLASGRDAAAQHPRRPTSTATPPPCPSRANISRSIREAMWGVVNGGGTGGAARMLIPGVALAGKTGTAQVRRITMAERRIGRAQERAAALQAARPCAVHRLRPRRQSALRDRRRART